MGLLTYMPGKACASRIGTLIILILTVAAPALGVELSGRAFHDWYMTEDSAGGVIRLYTGLQSSVLLTPTKNDYQLSLNGYGRWATNIDNNHDKDSDTRIYALNMRYSGKKAVSEAIFGRMYLYHPATSTVFDGIRIKTKTYWKFELIAFGGSGTDGFQLDKVNSLSDNLLTGGSLRYNARLNAAIGVHWLYRKQGGHTAYNLPAIDASYRYKRFDGYAKAVYNFTQLAMNRLVVRTSYRDADWYASAEYTNRQPALAVNSIFSIIEYYRVNEIRFSIERRVYRHFRIVAQTFFGKVSDENSQVLSAGIRGSYFTVLYRYYNGFGTDNNGLLASAYVPMKKDLFLFASADFSKYRIQESQDDDNDNISLSSGVHYRYRGFGLRLEYQYLRNAVEDNDARLLIRLDKRFHIGEGK
ncbi:MAG: hypothetical protein R3F48_00670 [Candidatus Zixiibacteriota bacterium]